VAVEEAAQVALTVAATLAEWGRAKVAATAVVVALVVTRQARRGGGKEAEETAMAAREMQTEVE